MVMYMHARHAPCQCILRSACPVMHRRRGLRGGGEFDSELTVRSRRPYTLRPTFPRTRRCSGLAAQTTRRTNAEVSEAVFSPLYPKTLHFVTQWCLSVEQKASCSRGFIGAA